ncbi:MAG: RlmF-related methyltransferase [Candidatus Hodarchaeota archaeon]
MTSFHEFVPVRQIDLTRQCVPLKEAAQTNSTLASMLKDGKIDLGDSHALSEYNKTVLQIKYGLEIQLPPGHLIPAVCLRSAFIQEVITPGQHILEVGTGSSAILAMIMGTIGCKVVATEANERNSLFAQRNIEKNGLESQIELRSCTPDKILSGVVKENERFDRIITYPPQYGKNWPVRFHGSQRGFGGQALELIGGNEGYEFAIHLVQELTETSVLNSRGIIALLVLNTELISKLAEEMRNMKWHYQIIEILAGTRHRYIFKGAPTDETKIE